MPAANMYQQYNTNKILTASPAELTLMLYDGCIKFCNIGLRGIEEGDVAKANLNIQKAERIIQEFKLTLDHKYPVAKDFDNVYDYIMSCLVDANIHKDKEKLEDAITHLRTMRDTWKEVMKTGRPKGEGFSETQA